MSGTRINANPIIQKILVESISGVSEFTVIGLIIAVSPKTDAILKIFEPIKLPNDMAFSFLSAAITEAANSGTLVPIAITVTDIA